MGGKPFAVIETDGHAGDGGTKTRIEAFLYCVREYEAAGRGALQAPSLSRVAEVKADAAGLRERGDIVLVPPMSAAADALAAGLRGIGLRAEVLPMPDRAMLDLGRRHTSGKECLPLAITLGSFLQRVAREDRPEQGFGLLMPLAQGPCRFGLYQLLQKLVLEQLGQSRRVQVWSPADREYFLEGGGAFRALSMAGVMAIDLLHGAFDHVRPLEREPGSAARILERYSGELLTLIEQEVVAYRSAAAQPMGRAVADDRQLPEPDYRQARDGAGG
jgi:hypothetical protein